jgi:hypothetical protein
LTEKNMTRRNMFGGSWIAAVAAALLVAAGATGATGARNGSRGVGNVVLVHGADVQ